MTRRRAVDGGRSRWWMPRVLAAVAGVIVGVATVVEVSGEGAGFAPGLHPALAFVPFVLAASYAFLGGLILRDRPGHGLGRLMAWFGLTLGLGVFVDNYVFHEPPLPARDGCSCGAVSATSSSSSRSSR